MTSQSANSPLIHLLLLLLPQLLFGFLAPDTNRGTPRPTLLKAGIYLPIVHDRPKDQEAAKDDRNGERLILMVSCHRVVRHSIPPNTKRLFDKSFELPFTSSLRRTNLRLKSPPTKEPSTSPRIVKPIQSTTPTKDEISKVDISTVSNNREDHRNDDNAYITMQAYPILTESIVLQYEFNFQYLYFYWTLRPPSLRLL